MKLTNILARGGLWTFGSYLANQLLRFATNIILARLLAPEIFGVMIVVNTLRTGISLFTDAGVTQSIIVNKNAESPEFYNTAWTINVARGVVLWLLSIVLAIPLAQFYKSDQLLYILPVVGFIFVIEGLASIAQPLLQKQLRFVRYNAFEIVVDAISIAAMILLAAISPSVWALVFGTLLASLIRTVGSYILLPRLSQRLQLTRVYLIEILNFGKWLFASSIAYFLASNFDRLFLAKVLNFEGLGVYGIAKTLAEPLPSLVGRLSGIIIFPLVASSRATSPSELREQVRPIRFLFVLAIAACMSVLAAVADILVWLLYDDRYQGAAWMAPILILGAWFTALCSLNESTVLGFGRASYGAIGNSIKLGWLAFGLPVAFMATGVLGAVLVVSLSDSFRYIPIFIGQLKSGFSFFWQDMIATLSLFALTTLWWWLRSIGGFGPTPMSTLGFF